MRQKYLISCDPNKHVVTIREYAVIDKNLNNTDTSLLRPEDYSLLYEIRYDGVTIKNSLSIGKKALISKLRTPSFFPAESHVQKIADSVVQLMHSTHQSTEVMIDDLEGKKIRPSHKPVIPPEIHEDLSIDPLLPSEE